VAYELKDYNEVVDRVRAFNEKFPDGSIQTEITHLSEKLVVVKAYAFRTPEDPKPSSGHSMLTIPGTTNFTRGSEVENAETSAVGRALSWIGFTAKKSLASADEIRNKTPDKAAPAPVDKKPTQPTWMRTVNVAAKEAGSSVRETLNLPDAANILIELKKWQDGNGYTDAEAEEEFKKIIPVKVTA
jgi:hypothetical protein